MSEPLERALEVGARQIVVRGDLVSPWLLKEAKRHDLQVICWAVNHPAHMRMLMEAGVDGIMSDYPDRALELTKSKESAK
jgi:glycerophosphoryl diester phosphodiesterase